MLEVVDRQHGKIFVAILFVLISALVLFNPRSLVFSATADHIVISEVQIAGTNATDEFVELYNPTDTNIDLAGFRLTRKTSGGTEANLVANISGTIPAHGYYLIAHPDYDGAPIEDMEYSASSNSLAAGATAVLYSDSGITLVDKVGMGEADDPEGSSTNNPDADSSVERKAQTSSTTESMGLGGSDQTGGNGEDTNDNGNDFVGRVVSQPQNAGSSPESSGTITPTVTGTLTPTPTPTVTTTLTPSPTPTSTSTPTTGRVVISEVQRSGGTADDEFVELYNPNDTEVNISDWKLTRINSTGTEGNLVSTFPDETTIAAHSFFLIAHEDYDGVAEDQTYTNNSNPIGTGSTIVLYDDSDAVVDKVGFGTELTPPTSPEGDPAGNPPIDGSLERKAQSTSTEESMSAGGADEAKGNGEDTDNNMNDFVERGESEPQNSGSPSEELGGTPTPTITTTPTSTPTATPTISPTVSPSPTATPTVTLTVTPTPTNPPTPSPTPTTEPSITPIVTPTPTPTITPMPHPFVHRMPIGLFRFPFRARSIICYHEYSRTFFGWSFPRLRCVRV